jgi:small subunit ribosomal protein S20
MPVKKTIAKRIRQAEKARVRNKHYNSTMKTAIKFVLSSTEKETAEKLGIAAHSVIDSIANKGIIHKNKAANQKSKVSRFINKLS